VVLIIIASVSIFSASGENGLFNKAQNYKEEYDVKVLNENLKTMSLEYARANNGRVSIDGFMDYLIAKDIINA
jgi:hypothetical protein